MDYHNFSPLSVVGDYASHVAGGGHLANTLGAVDKRKEPGLKQNVLQALVITNWLSML